ncbi:MAG: tyrosine-type recombinase/integrase [Pseudolabrys sp.]
MRASDRGSRDCAVNASHRAAAISIFRDAISAAFTRACQFLGIKDLRFHDLRHEGLSRLFGMGRTIPQAAAVSGHRSWTSLKRYTRIRQTGDKYKNWKWLPIVTTKEIADTRYERFVVNP